MTSKLTRERLEQLADNNTICKVSWDERIELAQIALAAMDSEPVALQPELAKVIYHFRDWNEGFPVERFKADYVISWMLANYPPAQPAKDREQVRREHAEWSQATFGNVGPIGPLKHLSKEALEAAEQPGDLSEWADMHFLLWDAQRRAGITDEQITQAMIEKLAVNKQRSWPEPKDGEPRLHIKEQQAPVVPDDVLDALQKVARIRLDMNDFDGDRRGIADCLGDAEEALIEVVNRRAAMLAAAPQLPGSEPATAPGTWIPVSERLPEDSGRYWCYVEEQNDLGKSHYQWNCSWNGDRWWVESEGGGIVTHWMQLPATPREVK